MTHPWNIRRDDATPRLPHPAGTRDSLRAAVLSAQADAAAATDGSSVALRAALDLASDAIFLLDASLRTEFGNQTAAAAVGVTNDALCAMSLTDVVDDGPDRPLLAALDRLLRGDTAHATVNVHWRRTADAPRRESGDRAVEIRLQRIDASGRVTIAAVLPVVADPHDAADTSGTRIDNDNRPTATRDYLTGLASRAELERRLHAAQSRACTSEGRFAVLFLDVDRFKAVNDAHGHRTGDWLLRTIAQRLEACVRPDDCVARYGGDEFVVLIEEVSSRAEVEAIAARIRHDVNNPIDLNGRHFSVSISVGMAIGHAASSAQDMVDAADRAMYRAKLKTAPRSPR